MPFRLCGNSSAFRRGGKEGVRELFLDLIIREDLKGGPVSIPDGAGEEGKRK